MYSDTHNIADLTNEELYRMRDYGKFEYDREAAAAELARRAFAIMHGEQECREQAAQPEADADDSRLQTLLVTIDESLICNPRAADRIRDLINDRLRNPYAADMASGKRGIAEQAQDAELAAENERLRVALEKAHNTVTRWLADPEPPCTAQLLTLADAIEAAKEAAHAN